MNSNSLLNILYSYKLSLVLMVANKYRIFDFLETSKHSLKEISKSTGLAEKQLKVLLDILTHIELISTNNQLYCNTNVSNKYLVSTKTSYIGHLIDLEIEDYQKNFSITNFEKVLHGVPIPEQSTNQSTYMKAMQYAIRYTSLHMARFIKKKNIAPTKILDIGGATGETAIILCKSFPNMEAVVFDIPETREFALENIKKNNLEKKIHVMSGNCLKNEFGCNYDVIIISNILHFFNECEIDNLLIRSKKALNTKGIIIINDHFISNTCIIPSLLSVDWLIKNNSFNISIDDMKKKMFNLGFEKQTDITFPNVPTTILVLEKN